MPTYTGRLLNPDGTPASGRVIAYQAAEDPSSSYAIDTPVESVTVDPVTGEFTIEAYWNTVNDPVTGLPVPYGAECYLVALPTVSTSNAKIVYDGVVFP